MKFKINRVVISNLRNIPYNQPLIFDLSKQNITILDGPNGYGKTTFFDAIELLVTGDLGHFFSGLYNRGRESLSSVAKDKNKNTVITAEIAIRDKGMYILTRTFCWDHDSTLIELTSPDGSTETVEKQDEIYGFFGITDSIFNIGMYISQSDSLNFLKLPYKDRKDKFSSIVGTDRDKDKNKYLVDLRKELLNKKDQYVSRLDTLINESSTKIEKYKKILLDDVENVQSAKYQKLFPKLNCAFDEELVEISDVKKYLDEISQIESFIELRGDFIAQKNNKTLEELVSYEKDFYCALFHEKTIKELKLKEEELIQIKQFEIIKQKYIEEKSPKYDNELFKKTFGASIDKINELNAEIHKKENKLSEITLQKKRLNEARSQLRQIHDAVHLLENNVCPYCGKDDENLIELYDILTNYVNDDQSETTEEIQEIEDNLEQFVNEVFVKEIDDYLKDYQSLIKNYEEFEGLFEIDPQKLENTLKDQKLYNFFMNTDNSFDNNYNLLLERIRRGLQPISTSISATDLVKYESISHQYFNDETPMITLADIQEKKAYLVYTLNSKSKRLKHDQELIKQDLEDKKKLYNEKIDNKIHEIEQLSSVYKKSIEKYNSDFLEDIKIPLFIISGRIMQTSPMGLGIEAKIDNRRIEFVSGTLTHDIVNMLSAGQLNGLMISILLAVQKTYLSNKGIRLFMIDDPLQSIDDLSAHSFVDLLTQEFADNQIIISTHELDKTIMFYYKYEQSGIPINRKNLQIEYLG
ncbi:hypothetical protein JZO70_14055 [Enterococcus sp. 669A]|uniref:Nuclease SbcCD subunit C n=1 Tax=Candidatus Enterococcus moelleringii TaxID=2815325 RepID=A0ABS3LCD9_9ENTE|nr:AAA family ATPase [Enterococcus sp. 669A]MBO1307297.1 hypothetical protein [Enterococcus sp. 669A]